jgi:hypothetical protein
MVNIAGGLAFGSDVSIAGSALVLTLTNVTRAYIDNNATAFSEGNVRVSADLHTSIDTVAGVGSISGSAGIGASFSTVITQDTTEAYIGNFANVTALAQRPAITVNTGEWDGGGNLEIRSLQGLDVSATSYYDILTIAAGSAAAQTWASVAR